MLKNFVTTHLSTFLFNASFRLSDFESAELLLGHAQLFQRAYNTMKKALKKRNILLCTKFVQLMRELEIGSVSEGCNDLQQGTCAVTDFKESMNLIFVNKQFVDDVKFPTPEQQQGQFKQLVSS